MAACRDCGLAIRFVKIIKTGKMLPVDPVPDENGNVWAWPRNAREWDGLVLSAAKAPKPGERPAIGPAMSTELRPRADAVAYMPHAATCPGRKRPAKPRPKPRMDEPLF